jgi:hypothetical protein
LIIILLPFAIAARRRPDIAPPDLRLSPFTALILLAALIVLFMIRAAEDTLTSGALVITCC